MAFNRPFSGNGRFNRGNNRGGNFSRGGNQNNQQGDNELPDYRGIAWGNRFRDQQKPGAPVLQGYATVGGEKLRVAGFLNPSPDHRDNADAQEYKEQVAAEINAILVDAQEQFGLAFNLTFQNEEEWRSERNNAQRSNGGARNFSRGGGNQQQFRSNRAPARPQQQEQVPFDSQGEEYGNDPEPAASPAPRARRAPAKPAAKPAAKRATRKSGK